MYQEFAKEWFAHEIHSYSLPQLNELVKSMGYTIKEIIEITNEYYIQQKLFLEHGAMAYKKNKKKFAEPLNTDVDGQINLDF